MNYIVASRLIPAIKSCVRYAVFGAVFLLFVAVVARAQTPALPAWWSTPVGVLDGQPTDNWAVANVGQLKHVATQAKAHLDAKLNLTNVDWDEAYSNVSPFPFPVGASIDNYAPLNIGQLKFVASGFYHVIYQKASGYNVLGRFVSMGVPASSISGSGPYYPWSSATGLGENWSPVTIGQLKAVFSFDLSDYAGDPPGADSDGNGLADAWELQYFGQLGADPQADPDGDGLTNAQESFANLNPTASENRMVAPNPAPSVPAEWDVFTPPVISRGSPILTPAIAEWTRSGGPDENLILAGDKFSSYAGTADEGRDTEFLVFGQTTAGNAVRKAASLRRLAGAKVAITLPADLPAWSTYLVWPGNNAGYGRPVAINRTEAWWIGPDAASRGDTVSVFGRNLSHGGGTAQSWIYVINKVTGAGQWATVVSVNPYRVQFALPGSFENGTYEVWAHNGHGGEFGWSGPLELKVANRYVWTSDSLLGGEFDPASPATFNVKAEPYNARGDGITDDTDAIIAAFQAAVLYRDTHPGLNVTLYFPEGVYMMRRGLAMPSNFRFLGAGKTRTVLRCMPNFNPDNPTYGFGLFFGNTGDPRENIEIRDMTLDSNNQFGRKHANQDAVNNPVMLQGAWPAGCANFKLTNLRIRTQLVRSSGQEEQPSVPCASIDSTTRLSITNCDFEAGKLVLLGGRQHVVRGCTFLIAKDQDEAFRPMGVSEISITNNECRDLEGDQSTGAGSGRFIATRSAFLPQENAYIGANTTRDLGPTGLNNAGEQILSEGDGYTYYSGPSAESSPSTVKVRLVDNADLVGGTITVIHQDPDDPQKQVKQVRTIDGYDSASRTITVSQGWTPSFANVRVHNINISGKHTRLEPKFVSSTGMTVTVANVDRNFANHTAVIVDGKGMGQYRRITGYDPSTGVATVSPEWNVPPDPLSRVNIGGATSRWVIYGNRLDGKENYEQYSAVTAVQPWGLCFEWLVDSNVVTHMRHGIVDTGMRDLRDPDHWPAIAPNYFNYYANNDISDSYEGVFHSGGANSDSSFPGTASFGTVYRSNRFSNLSHTGVRLPVKVYKGVTGVPVLDMVVFEGNSFNNLPRAIDASDDFPAATPNMLKNPVFDRNQFATGSATAGSGIVFGANQEFGFSRNTWTGFQPLYSGDIPGPLLELPWRKLRFSGSATQTGSFIIANAGTGNLSWTASSSVAWLTVQNSTGSVLAGDQQPATISCDPAGLSPGKYVGVIAVTAGIQTKKATVEFTVEQP